MLILLLSGCASQSTWEKVGEVNVMYSMNPHIECKTLFGATSGIGQTILGCHTMIGTQHFIIVRRGDSRTMEHELRHTTEGNWHDN